jgi:hypothetical protein
MGIYEDQEWSRDQDRFRMQIDERRKWDEWERRKERAAEPVEPESDEA